MKRFSFLFLAGFAVASCGNNGKVTHTQKNADGSITTASMNVSSMVKNSDDMNQKIEDLKKLTPLNLEQLKTLLPETVNGVKRSSFNTNSMMGFGVAEAEYNQDGKDLKVVIYDCAGEAGSGIFALTYMTQMNMQSESDNGYTKTVKFKGSNALEAYDKNSNQSTFTYIANDRLMVILTGINVDNATLQQVAGSLNLNLKNA